MKSLPLSVSLFCQPECPSTPTPSPSNPVSALYPSLAPFITTPCAQVMMHFVAYCWPTLPLGLRHSFLFELRAHCGLNISWTVSLPSLHDALPKYIIVLFYSPVLFYTLCKCVSALLSFPCEMWKLITSYWISHPEVYVLCVQKLIVPPL